MNIIKKRKLTHHSYPGSNLEDSALLRYIVLLLVVCCRICNTVSFPCAWMQLYGKKKALLNDC